MTRGKHTYPVTYIAGCVGTAIAETLLLLSIPIYWAEISEEQNHGCGDSTRYIRLTNGLCDFKTVAGDIPVDDICIPWDKHREWRKLDETVFRHGDVAHDAIYTWPKIAGLIISSAVLSLIALLFALHGYHLHFGASKISKYLLIVLLFAAMATGIIGWALAATTSQVNDSSYDGFFSQGQCDGNVRFGPGYYLAVISSGILYLTLICALF